MASFWILHQIITPKGSLESDPFDSLRSLPATTRGTGRAAELDRSVSEIDEFR
jgi:hypothetical protein